MLFAAAHFARRALFPLALIVLMIAIGLPPAHAAEPHTDDATGDVSTVGSMDQAVVEAETALAEVAEALQELTEQRKELEQQLEAADAKLEEATAAEVEASEELAVLNYELDVRREQRDKERDRLQGQARESWKRGTGGAPPAIEGTLEILDDARSTRSALRGLDSLRYLMGQQAVRVETLEELTARVAQLQRRHAQLLDKRKAEQDRATEARDELAKATEDLRVLEEQAAATTDAKAAMLDALVAERDDLRAIQTELSQSVDDLRRRMVTVGGHAKAPAELLQYGNGRIPAEALEPIGVNGHRLWAPAAMSFMALLEQAKADGIRIGVTDSYRSYALQVDVAERKGLYSEGGLAARPGYSNHGWGLSVDLDLDAKAQAWMRANAYRYYFVEDTPREPWHWTFIPN